MVLAWGPRAVDAGLVPEGWVAEAPLKAKLKSNTEQLPLLG